MRQQLTTMGFADVKLVSLDRKPDGYLSLRSAINEQRLMLPSDMPTVEKELINLERDNQTGKVDHPPDGSKDIADSLAGAVFNASEHNAEFNFSVSEVFGEAINSNIEYNNENADGEILLQSLITPLSSIKPTTKDE